MVIGIAFILLFAPLFITLRFCKCENGIMDFMSMEFTTMLRAVAILMIMQQHLCGFVFGSRIFTPFGGGVAIFLIISGYGLTKSAQRKGFDNFWNKKFVRVFLPWAIVWIVLSLIGKEVAFTSVSSLFLLDSTNWYLQYLLLCYIVFYVGFRWLYQYRWPFMICFSLLSFFLWGNIQAEQSCSFMMGCFMAEQSNVLVRMKKNMRTLCTTSFLLFAMALCLKQIGFVRQTMESNFVMEHTLNLVLKQGLAWYVIALCFLFRKYINGKYAQFVGKISYELYLIHLFVMIGVCKTVPEDSNVRILTFVIGSFVGSYLLYIADSRMLKAYSKKKHCQP